MLQQKFSVVILKTLNPFCHYIKKYNISKEHKHEFSAVVLKVIWITKTMD